MNRTVKQATMKAFHYPNLDAPRAHVLAFVQAYNFAKRLRVIRWRAPFQAACNAWTNDPSIFKINPHYLIPGPRSAEFRDYCHRRRCRPAQTIGEGARRRVLRSATATSLGRPRCRALPSPTTGTQPPANLFLICS